MTQEGAVLRSILDYLAARHILAFRMNSGAVSAEHNGKKRFMRFGAPGMADVLAFVITHTVKEIPVKGGIYTIILTEQRPTWIEVKAAKGKQSELQKSFQAQVEREGHKYVLARSVDDVEAALL